LRCTFGCHVCCTVVVGLRSLLVIPVTATRLRLRYAVGYFYVTACPFAFTFTLLTRCPFTLFAVTLVLQFTVALSGCGWLLVTRLRTRVTFTFTWLRLFGCGCCTVTLFTFTFVRCYVALRLVTVAFTFVVYVTVGYVYHGWLHVAVTRCCLRLWFTRWLVPVVTLRCYGLRYTGYVVVDYAFTVCCLRLRLRSFAFRLVGYFTLRLRYTFGGWLRVYVCCYTRCVALVVTVRCVVVVVTLLPGCGCCTLVVAVTVWVTPVCVLVVPRLLGSLICYLRCRLFIWLLPVYVYVVTRLVVALRYGRLPHALHVPFGLPRVYVTVDLRYTLPHVDVTLFPLTLRWLI